MEATKLPEEIESISSSEEEDGAEDSLDIKPPQSSKFSSQHARSRSSGHVHSSQRSKHDRHKKSRRSKEHHKSPRLGGEHSSRYSSESQSKDMVPSRKHRHHVAKERDVRSVKDPRELKDAREILKRIREERGSKDKEWVKDRRDREKDDREHIEREKRRDRLMMAEREREHRSYPRLDDKSSQLSSHSRRNQTSRSDSQRLEGDIKRHDRSRSPVSRKHHRDKLNAKLKEKLKAIKSEEENGNPLDHELVMIVSDNENITSEDNKANSEVSEKEEGEHTDDDEDEDHQEMEVGDDHNDEELNVSESGSSSSSDEKSVDEESSSEGDTVSEEDSASENNEDDPKNEKSAEEKLEVDDNNLDEKVDDEYSEIGPHSSPEIEAEDVPKLPPYLPAIQGCRSVEEFHCLNRIEEGTFGVVYRARDKKKDEIVALKRLKMENEKEGFPITSLREINTLLKAQHVNIVTCREIVVGSNMDKIYIVMDYVEHDLKSLMEGMKQPFLIGEVKTLLIQLLRAVAHLHDNWILHRDLKTSNLLLSHRGILKVGDFGLAREYGSPLKQYTTNVVTLWYRAPELLLGTKEYSCPIDMWSVGCILGEIINMKPMFPGKSDIDQLNKIFKSLGTPNEIVWPGYSELPIPKKIGFANIPYNTLRGKFGSSFDNTGFDLLNRLLTYDPKKRITAEDAKLHEWFKTAPKPVNPSMFPTWPAKSEQVHHRRTAAHSPKAPSGGKQFKLLKEADENLLSNDSIFHMNLAKGGNASKGPGFMLKF